jgi:hypothetical protein
LPTFIEYEIEENVTILIQAPNEAIMGIVKAAEKDGEPVILKSEKKFTDALEGVRHSAIAIKQKLEDLRADEVEVKFGITTTGKLGNFAIAEVGVEANYEVTLKWKNPSDSPKKATN